MKKLFNSIKKKIDIIWIVIYVATLFILLITSGNRWGFECFENLIEQKDYYVKFLWPSVYPYVAAGLGISTLAVTFVYSECLMSESIRLKKHEELVVKNIAHIITIISNACFILVNIIGLKCLNWILVYLAVIIVFAIISFKSNLKEYREVDLDNKEDVWTTGTLRLSIILAALIGGTLLLGGGLVKGIQTAKTDFIKMNGYKIELSYGHLIGFEDNRAIAKIEFVNMYGSSGEEYSFEQLEQEYINFKSGKGSWSNLWLFCEESVNIELTSHLLDVDYGYYPYYETYGELGKYYFSDVTNWDDQNRNKAYDKFLDVEFFCVCVEHDLNSKGLTLSQVNDSSYAACVKNRTNKRDYIPATYEQVKEACRNYANLREPLDGGESQLENIDNLEVKFNVGIGDRLLDAKVQLNDAFYISDTTWFYEDTSGEMKECKSGSKVKKGKKYSVIYEIEIPYMYHIDDEIRATVNGVECDEVYIEKNKNGENKVEIQLTFTAAVENWLTINGLEIGLEFIFPEDVVAECDNSDESTLCDAEYVGWQVYDIETGIASDYTEEMFSADNLCYIAVLDVTPDDDASFENVNVLYCGYNINIYEYDEELHRYQPGKYPKAYFVKLNEDGQEHIMAYIPYYMAQTTGVDGDVINTGNEGNYVYLVEGGILRFRDRPKYKYQVYEYRVTDYDGTTVDVGKDLMMEQTFMMPAHPVIVTGYFEPKN